MILYVEDELPQNIPRIIQLFGKLLGEERIRHLKDLENDEYGASPEEIKQIVDETNVIEVEFRFPDALRKILFQHRKYDLLIIDRNLSGNEYTSEEINEIDRDYSDLLGEEYAEREGDYLFVKLASYSQEEVLKKVRFLTASSNHDELRKRRELSPLFDNWLPRIKKIVYEKADPNAIKLLQNDVMNIPQYRAREEKHS